METGESRASEIKAGMQLAAQLPDIMPDKADEQIQRIYEDIQGTLRVPFVNLIFRVLANYPNYLIPAWQSVSPTAGSAAFEQASDRLREAALLEKTPERVEQELHVPEALRGFNDTIHYVLPKLLLVATILEGSPAGTRADHPHDLPHGPADGTVKIEMVDPGKASGEVARTFESIKAAHGHPLVSSYFRALGQWPHMLALLWARLEPVVGSAPFEARKARLIDMASAEATALGLRSLPAPIGVNERGEVASLLTAFRRKFIPEMLIDVATIKAMLDGRAVAASSRFSAAG